MARCQVVWERSPVTGQRYIESCTHEQSALYLFLVCVADARMHKETGKRPIDMFEDEKPHLRGLLVSSYDIGQTSQVRASVQYRISLDDNRYTVPAQLAGVRLTLRKYPDHLCIYHEKTGESPLDRSLSPFS